MVKDGPRGPMSSYAFFIQVRREDFQKKHPNESVDFTQFSQVCSQEWKKMSNSDKDKYIRMGREDRARYEEEMRRYLPPDDSKKKKRAKKDPDAPKRSLSAFFWFCNEERGRVKAELPPTTSFGDVSKECANRWNELSLFAKAKYEDLAAKDKARYEKEIASYRLKQNVLTASPNKSANI